jgi:glycosyltransferase involved in cell wall biosynthesis
VSPCVIVIDGESDDGTFTDLQATYSGDARVQLLQNGKSTGFMNTCFQGVDLVKSKWVTFMYDDDVLSPHFIEMAANLVGSSSRFIMGYGAPFPADSVYPFKPVEAFRPYSPQQLLLAYFGRHDDIDFKGLPFSPIACVTTLDLLQQWVPQVKRFCSQNSLRQHFMLKRNIGPDLMIYLFSLIQHQGDVSLAVAIMAQFSAHPSSMSIIFGNSDLAVGYWLGKIWAFEYLRNAGRREEAAICGSAIVLVGAKLLLARLMRFEIKWSGAMIREILGVVRQSIQNHDLLRTIKEGYFYMSEWKRGRNRDLIPS